METQNKGKKAARCPKCGGFFLQRAADLNSDEKMIFDRLPASANYTKKEREQHLYCPRCGHESAGRQLSTA